jgi:hypothetical protein
MPMSFISVLVCESSRLLMASICVRTCSYSCSFRASGPLRPNRRASLPCLFGPKSAGGSDRSVVTISFRACPAAPAFLLRTPSSISSATSVTASCAALPKKMMELLSSMSISAIARSISARLSSEASA